MTVPSKRLAEYFFICGINFSKGLQNDTVAGKTIAGDTNVNTDRAAACLHNVWILI